MKKTTEKQIAANRRNAMKSTGPRTARGREISKMNALKHGILSKEVLVRSLVHGESKEELEALHLRFWEELEPSGPLEELLVDQIVTAHWRLRRALLAESGEIELGVDAVVRRRRGPDPVLQWMTWMAQGDPIHAMEGCVTGIRVLESWISDLRGEVEDEGELTERVIANLVSRFGHQPNSLTLALEACWKRIQSEGGCQNADEEGGRERRKAKALEWIDGRLRSLRFQCDCITEQEDAARESRLTAAALPSGQVLEKILRYETKLERQLFRAMAQLERMQRMRRGEVVPAPISVDVAERE